MANLEEEPQLCFLLDKSMALLAHRDLVQHRRPTISASPDYPCSSTGRLSSLRGMQKGPVAMDMEN